VRIGLLLMLSLFLAQPASVPDAPSACSADRLLVAGADASQRNGVWWVSPDEGTLRQISSGGGAIYFVSVSPDQRWAAYYQGPDNYNPATDRFVVDTWVLDLETEAATKLVDGSSPLGWVSDSSALVLGQHPDQMVLVPSGQVVPTQGNLMYAQSMRAALSPDQQFRAVVDTTPQGANGISILDSTSGDEVWHIPTGRGAPQLAWSRDAQRLAFTSGTDSQDGLIWKLRMASVADHSVQLVNATQDLFLHSVLWAPASPDCA
jgi:dipeptidyl aminopeptidase/acylaminoacyl peptidase